MFEKLFTQKVSNKIVFNTLESSKCLKYFKIVLEHFLNSNFMGFSLTGFHFGLSFLNVNLF